MEDQHLKVFLVDDDEDEYIIVMDLLSEMGGSDFDLEWTQSYDVALETMVQNRHNVYLVDYHLGEYNGLELLRAAIDNGCEKPITLLTGYGRREIDVEAMQAGAVDYLEKQGLAAPLLERSIRYAIAHKQAEKSLRESEERFRTVADFTYDWEYWLDPAGNFVYVSPSCERITGYRVDEFVQDSDLLQRIIHPDDQDVLVDHKHAVTEDGEILAIDFRIVTHGGEERWIGHICQPVYGDDGRYLGQRASNRDITERVRTEALRRQAEEALQESEKRLRLMIENMPVLMDAFDAQGNILVWNQECERVTGFSAAEIVGNPRAIQLLYPDEDYRTFITEQLAEYGENFRNLEWNLACKDGNKKTILWSNMSEQFPIPGWRSWAVGLDITERKRAEQALQQATEAALEAQREAEAANRAKSVFLSSMSHELRTPLNAILGFTQLMARAPLDTPLHTQRDNLNIINRSGKHLLTLINDVLTMSKIEAGRMTFDVSSFDLHHMLDGIVVMFGVQARSKGLSLEMERAPNVPRYVRMDEGKLRQVLVNLLDNAIKFTNEGGVVLRVKVDKERKDRSLSPISISFEVEDTGSGIAHAEMDVLFDPFVQTASGRKSLAGTGLGLPISRQFVQAMGGDMAVSSEAGKGSRFAFEAPFEAADPSTIRTGAAAQGQIQKQIVGLAPDQPTLDGPYRILVVEDNPESRLLMLKLLQPLGFDVREAVNGKEGIAIHASWQPHLIFMDMRMPVMDGYEAVRQIRDAEAIKPAEGEQKPPTPIIALTASSLVRDDAHIVDAGCDDTIRKPFQHSVIFEKLAQYLDVRFVYAEQAAATSEIPAGDDALLSEQIAALSPEWRARLNHAASAGDRQKTYAVIAQIREQEPGLPRSNLADSLTRLAHNLRFDRLIELTEAQEDET
ncbi:MAG: response regulator [Chloroflexi bacterium]|nr:response regulator [Chloroflexota bacterium]